MTKRKRAKDYRSYMYLSPVFRYSRTTAHARLFGQRQNVLLQQEKKSIHVILEIGVSILHDHARADTHTRYYAADSWKESHLLLL